VSGRLRVELISVRFWPQRGFLSGGRCWNERLMLMSERGFDGVGRMGAGWLRLDWTG